ncbi:MAG TPA: DUF342 domain-containing protein [Firmicutes bacterium]|nr:DUF342 domain-containing protein [Candidatus Fermentithermobacillaceae bacterium]
MGSDNNLEGKVPEKGWAKVENGRVIVSDPEPGEMGPVIVPCEEIQVSVNGRIIWGPTPVSSRDSIVLTPKKVEPKVSIGVTVESDGMEAYVTVRAEDGAEWTVADVPASSYLNIRAEKHVIPAEVRPEDIQAVLSQKGIVFGIKADAVAKAAREKSGEPVLVAEGLEPKPGKDGHLEFLVPMERVLDLPADSLRVDFRDTVKIPMVKKGQVTAVKRKPVPGEPGKTVFGKDVPAPKPEDPKLRPGKGVILEEEGDFVKVVAILDGYPIYRASSGVYEVDEIYRVNGDVNLASGNIKFVGTVEVSGNVTDGMKVYAEGNVRIRGTVTGAEIRAWRNVEIGGNVFQSTVVAGRDTSDIKKWDDMIRTIESRLLALTELVPGAHIAAVPQEIQEDQRQKPIDAQEGQEAQIQETQKQKAQMGQMQGHEAAPQRAQAAQPATQGVAGQDLKADASRLGLLDRLRALIMALNALNKMDASKTPAVVREAIAKTREILADNRTELGQRLRRLASTLSVIRSWVEGELSGGQADVLLPYCQNCTIESARDIVITGQGAFYSTLTAGRSIKASGSTGVIRGGEARATDLIQVRVAGGQGATPTVLRVSEKGRIIADEVYPNTILIVGRFKARTENLQRSVKARIVNDRLVVNTMSGTVEVDSG